MSCMVEGCRRQSTWRSDDGYPFCDNHAYWIYLAECDTEGVGPMRKEAWDKAGKPHGPECEHETVTTYTYRDWYETGIPEGTVCEDCGKEVELEDTRSFYIDTETGKVAW